MQFAQTDWTDKRKIGDSPFQQIVAIPCCCQLYRMGHKSGSILGEVKTDGMVALTKLGA